VNNYPYKCGNPNCWCAKSQAEFKREDIHLDDIDAVIKSNHKIIDQLKTLNDKLKRLKDSATSGD